MSYRIVVIMLALLFFGSAQADTFSYRYLDIVKSSAEYDF